MNMLGRLSSELEQLVARTAPGVVGVESPRGQGSGLVLASDGYVVTNAHVVRGASRLRVRLPGGGTVAATLVGRDRPTDLAVLRAATGDLASLPLCEATLRAGQLVVAIGFPLRLDRSVSLGVVSALDRTLVGPDGTLFEGLVQTDAAINPGNSGGPLLDAEGQVIGINTAIVPFANGIGFAIPARTVSWVAASLIAHGAIRRRYLGVSARSEQLVPAVAERAGQPRAVRIHEVGLGSPADTAGLRDGDLVLRADEQPLSTVDDLQRIIVLSPEPEVSLDVLRGRARRRLGVRPRTQAA